MPRHYDPPRFRVNIFTGHADFIEKDISVNAAVIKRDDDGFHIVDASDDKVVATFTAREWENIPGSCFKDLRGDVGWA